MIRPLLALLALVAFAHATASAQRPPAGAQRAPAPCTTATPECTEWVAVGGGPGRSLVYRNFPLATRNEAVTRAVIVVHGAGRDADNYYRSALAQNEISWNCDTWRSGGPSPSNPAVTSFDFLDEIVRQLARREVFPNLQGITVTGHSAGGQVTNRYGMSSKVHDALGVPVQYVVANPSSYAWPTDERPTGPAAWPLQAGAPGFVPAMVPDAPAFRSLRDGRGCTVYNDWPYGFRNRTGYTAALSDSQLTRQLASRPFTYVLSEVDVLPLSGFDGSCAAMAQGPTRQARGQAYAKYVNERLGGHHAVVVVTGCGHNGRCIYTSEPWLRVAFPRP